MTTHSKKMLLVPAETILGQQDPYAKKMSDLDIKMDQIMKRKDLDEFNKVLQYQQILEEYLAVRQKLLRPTPIPIIEQQKDQPTSATPVVNNKNNEDSKVVDTVLKSVPKSYKNKAERLLTIMKDIPNLTWSDKGEMVLDGKRFDGSHYVDLVNDVLRKRTTKIPIGWEALASELGKVNIPQDLVGNEDRWSYMKTPKTPQKKMLTATFPFDAVESSLPTPPQSKRKHKRRNSLNGPITKRHINWDFNAV